ncbi:competence protein [Enterococcus saccharolyticus]|uniref:Competence protein n=1 Tax=Candidatus Enterococcus willemsii TaxID=1857215 RepID=A0ABQ6YWN0_9ENTE|nr:MULTISPECIES: competence protein CoiA family protein [Enterococcus]KAF1302096.1 competence protein [Enterococcus sp. CU12B]MCD5001925.1 competence protein [Enterococcus saccharolyticus]
MLVAETKAGIKVYADKCKGKVEAICPSCKAPVRLKHGKIKIPHFAHVAYTGCAYFSEGETLEHLMNKQMLLTWSGSGQLEAYLPELQQRPDLLINRVAVEIQCSPLSLTRLIERTKNYQNHHYQPWWLVGQKLTPRKRWSHLQKAFSYYDFKKGCHLWVIANQQKEIQLFYHIRWHFQLGYFFQKKRWRFMESPLAQVFLFEPDRSDYHWEVSAYRYTIQKKLFQGNEKIQEIQEQIYRLKGNIQTLPEWCYSASEFFFYFEDLLLFLRYCVTVSANFHQWLDRIKSIDFSWYFPLVSQKEILRAVYDESCFLQESSNF